MANRCCKAGSQVALAQAADEGLQLGRLGLQELERLGLVGILVLGGVDPVHLVGGRRGVLAPDPGLAAQAVC